MFPEELAGFMERMCGSVKWVKLPVDSRDPARVARRLEPLRCRENGILMLGICHGIQCFLCAWSGEYRVEYSKVRVGDVLSGVNHWVRIPRGIINDTIVWEGLWRGDRFRVDSVTCFARMYPGGVECGVPGLHCEVINNEWEESRRR